MSPRDPREERASTTSSRAPSIGLPALEQVEVELMREVSRSSAGFLGVRELELRNRYADGVCSAPYRYFVVERAYLDAVAIVLYRRRGGQTELVLRSQLRPPLAFRAEYEVPLPAHGTGAVQWEIPAGLIEPGERGTEGLFARASAEALEETGLSLASARFSLLGPPASLSPGLIAEKLHFVCAEVTDADPQAAPRGDGHAVEERSLCTFVTLEVALAAIDDDLVHDVKTEVGIRRLADRLRRDR